MKRTRRPSRPFRRSGLTILEVIISLAILSGIGSVLFGTIGFTENAAKYDRHRLNAMEVAHRIVIQWIDDPKWIRNQPKRTEYDGHMYVFDVQELILVNDAEGDNIDANVRGRVILQSDLEAMGQEGAGRIAESALRVLGIRVWLQHEDGSVDADPLVHMTRTYWLNATKRGQEEMFEILLRSLNNGRAGEQ